VDRFRNWMQSRGAIPTVVALRQRFETVRRSELERLEPKLSGLSPEARARVDEITRLIVEKLLINPTAQLKNLSDSETIAVYVEVLNRLFDLSRTGQEDSSLQKELTAAFATPGHRAEQPRPTPKTSSS
jgi:glutamyl-tRNA reductase